MKKMFLFAMIVMGLLVSGCCWKCGQIPTEGWSKEGLSRQQLQQDYSECRGVLYIKEGMTYDEYEKDLNLCINLTVERHRTGESLAWASIIASEIVKTSSRGLCKRCMESKGYRSNSASESDLTFCMQEKGYRWEREGAR